MPRRYALMEFSFEGDDVEHNFAIPAFVIGFFDVYEDALDHCWALFDRWPNGYVAERDLDGSFKPALKFLHDFNKIREQADRINKLNSIRDQQGKWRDQQVTSLDELRGMLDVILDPDSHRFGRQKLGSYLRRTIELLKSVYSLILYSDQSGDQEQHHYNTIKDQLLRCKSYPNLAEYVEHVAI